MFAPSGPARADGDLYVRLGWAGGDKSGRDWENALPGIQAAWDKIPSAGTFNIFIEKTVGGRAYGPVAGRDKRWYWANLVLNHFGGLTPAGKRFQVHRRGDISRVVATRDWAFKVTKHCGVGRYSARAMEVRFRNMQIEGGPNCGAVLFEHIGTQARCALFADNVTFVSGPGNRRPAVVFGAGLPPQLEVGFRRVVVRGGNGGLELSTTARSTTGAGPTRVRLTNTAFVNTGAYGLYARSQGHPSGSFNLDVELDQVTFVGVGVAVWLGPTGRGRNRLVSSRSLYVPGDRGRGLLFRNDDNRPLEVTGSGNAAYQYKSFFRRGGRVEVSQFATVAADPNGDPGLMCDPADLRRDRIGLTPFSDPRLIDASEQGAAEFDAQGSPRPQGMGWDTGADELEARPI